MCIFHYLTFTTEIIKSALYQHFPASALPKAEHMCVTALQLIAHSPSSAVTPAAILSKQIKLLGRTFYLCHEITFSPEITGSGDKFFLS